MPVSTFLTNEGHSTILWSEKPIGVMTVFKETLPVKVKLVLKPINSIQTIDLTIDRTLLCECVHMYCICIENFSIYQKVLVS